MNHKLIRIISSYLLLLSYGLAQEVYYGDGVTVFPLKNTEIQIVSEHIQLRYQRNGEWRVEVEENLKNHGPATNIEIGWPFDTHFDFASPEEYAGDSVNIQPEYDPQFKTYINGKPVAVVSNFSPENPDIGFYYRWIYTFSTEFAPNETKIIRHSYNVGGQQNSMGGTIFRYILKTGRLWKGDTEEIAVEMSFNESEAVNFNCVYPKEHSATERDGLIVLNWKFDFRMPDIHIEGYSNLPQRSEYANVDSLINAILYPYYEGAEIDNRCRIRYLRNLIFAAYGYPFKNPFIRAHFYKSYLNQGPRGYYYNVLAENKNFDIKYIENKDRKLLDRLNEREQYFESISDF